MTTMHISSVADGAIVNFPHSLTPYMKVCSGRTGVGAVVDIGSGSLLTIPEAIASYGEQAEVIADSVYEWANS